VLHRQCDATDYILHYIWLCLMVNVFWEQVMVLLEETIEIYILKRDYNKCIAITNHDPNLSKCACSLFLYRVVSSPDKENLSNVLHKISVN